MLLTPEIIGFVSVIILFILSITYFSWKYTFVSHQKITENNMYCKKCESQLHTQEYSTSYQRLTQKFTCSSCGSSAKVIYTPRTAYTVNITLESEQQNTTSDME